MEKGLYDGVKEELRARVEALGYECAGVELVSEAGADILRVYLEMPGGVDTGDCETVSRELSAYLDTIEDKLPEHYLLEISSPGIERSLFSAADYRRFAGNAAKIYLRKRGGSAEGILGGITPEDEIMIETSDGQRTIPIGEIKRAHLICAPQKGQKKSFRKIPKKKK